MPQLKTQSITVFVLGSDVVSIRVLMKTTHFQNSLHVLDLCVLALIRMTIYRSLERCGQFDCKRSLRNVTYDFLETPCVDQAY